MTMPSTMDTTAQVQCPVCHTEQPALLYHVIDVGQRPELKQKLLEKQLFGFRCQNCGHEQELFYDSLYHDPDKKLMIYALPSEDGDCSQNLAPVLETVSKMPQLQSQGYVVRAVCSPNDLMEKVQIAEGGRDDRAIELCKLLLSSHWAQQNPDVPLVAVYYDRQEGQELVHLFDSSWQMISLVLEPAVYDEVAKAAAPVLQTANLSRDLLVNRDWALRHFAGSGVAAENADPDKEKPKEMDV